MKTARSPIRQTRSPRITHAHLVALASYLTDRDRQIALDCYEHHVLTTEQLTRLHFSGQRTARARLQRLHTLRVLNRFRPDWPHGHGSPPYHWILGEAGAYIIAAEKGIERRQLGWRHTAALAIADSAKLAHHVQINEFITLMAYEAAAAGGALTEWYGERTTSTLFHRVTPDAYAVLRLPGRDPLHILLELDRGTEHPSHLHDKAVRYTKAVPRSPLRDLCPLIILAVPTVARARAATAALVNTAAPIAVTIWSPPSDASVLRAVLAATMGACLNQVNSAHTASRLSSPAARSLSM